LLPLSQTTKRRARARERDARRPEKINFIKIAVNLVRDAKQVIKREGKITDWDLQQTLECNDYQLKKTVERVVLDSFFIKHKHDLLFNKQQTLENQL